MRIYTIRLRGINNYGPTTDLSVNELNSIIHYTSLGGSVLITNAEMTLNDNSMTYFNSLIAYYGVEITKGIVVESYGNCMAGYLTNVFPQHEKHVINMGIEKEVLFRNTQGLNILSDDIIGKNSNIYTTSDDSYVKTNLLSPTIEFEEGDIHGPVSLGVAIEDNTCKKMVRSLYMDVLMFLNLIY